MSHAKHKFENGKGYLCIALGVVSLVVAVAGTLPVFMGIGVLFFGVAATNLNKKK